jgi:hypothetical protein
VERLRTYWAKANERCEDLGHQLAEADDFPRSLHGNQARPVEAADVEAVR